VGRAWVGIPIGDLTSFEAAFVTNAIGIAAVRRIDDLPLGVNVDLMTTVTQVYESGQVESSDRASLLGRRRPGPRAADGQQPRVSLRTNRTIVIILPSGGA